MKKVTGKGFNPRQVKKFDWELFPKTEKFLQKEVNRFLQNNKVAKKLAKDMETKTNTRFFDWIDHMNLPHSRISTQQLKKFCFLEIKSKTPKDTKAFKNKKSTFFPILRSNTEYTEIAIKPEVIEHFTKKYKRSIQGKKYAPVRYAEISKEKKYLLSALERAGSSDFIVENTTDIPAYKQAVQRFQQRKRSFKTDINGLESIQKEIQQVLKTLSPARTADAFFRAERLYWQKRNKAGRFQKRRQNTLGLGWGNHDHHTYRSSRENFKRLIKVFELLGFTCREQFFAGEKAGWGAQILEHPKCDIVIFADVDLNHAEKNKDFAHKGLPTKKELGTVGLWIGLHGESILQAGMHHLEARFQFEQLRKRMKFMNPFSYFPFLKQAFSQSERWKVDKKRINKLVQQGSITPEQGKWFLQDGAIGSHLENLQRRQGFKGFNQTSVTAIIKATDPRKQITHKGA